MISHSEYVWHLLHCTGHYIFTLWHQTTIFVTSHPLYLISYPLYLCHQLTVLIISNQLYLWDLIRYMWHHIHYIWHHSHCICVITPLFRWYHTVSMYDITPTIWITSYTLYKVSHPHFMRSHHIFYDVTCTVFMTSLPLYLKLHPLYLCHHNHSIDDLRPTVYMT